MKRILRFLLVLILLFSLFACKTKSGKKERGVSYVKGNIYRSYGKKMSGERLVEILASFDPTGITGAIFDTRWAKSETEYKIKQFEGNKALDGYTTLYTGVLREKGDAYTWGYKIINVYSIKELIANSGFKKPVYVSVHGKTLPLTAIINEDGTISSGLGVKTDDFIYVSLDTIEEADIWYYHNSYSNEIRNKGFELGAISAIVGECCYAQASSNMLLLKDIARLTKCIEIAGEDITNKQYDEMLKAMTKDKIDMLNDSLKAKVKIQRKLTNAISGAVAGIIKAGMDFSTQIAKDVLKIAGWSNPLSNSFSPGSIAEYFIELYGEDEEARKYGEIAQKNYDKNFKKGQKRMKEAREILKKQKAILEIINKGS